MSALRARQNARKPTEQLVQDISKMSIQEPTAKYTLKQDNIPESDASEIEVYDDTEDNDNFNTDGTYQDQGLDEVDQSELHLMKNPMNFTKTKIDLSAKQLEDFFHINEFDPTIFDELSEVPVIDRIYIAAFLFYYHYKNEINRVLDSYPLTTNSNESNEDMYLVRYINFLIKKTYFKLNFTNASTLLNDRSSNDLFTRIILIFKTLQADNPLKNMKYIPVKTLEEEFYTLKKPMPLNYYNTVTQKTMRDILDIINNYTDIEFVTPFGDANCDQPIELSFVTKKELFVEENLVKNLPNILRNIMKIKFNTNRFTLDQLETIIRDYPKITEFMKQFNKCLRDYNTFTNPRRSLPVFGPKNRPVQVKRIQDNLFIPKKKSKN
jgi:hypothetical protein